MIAAVKFAEIEPENSKNSSTKPPTLETLVELAQAGDRDAFGELATRFEGMVYAIALRRLGNHSEAQELCQEVLVKAMQKIEQLEVPAAFGGWLRSITVRMAINRQVRRAPLIATEPQTLEATCIESTHAARRGAGQRAGGRRSAAAWRGWASSIGTRSRRFTSAASRWRR